MSSPPSCTDYNGDAGYRNAAVTLWGEAGAYVHDTYDRWRHLYPELPATLPIVIGLTAYGHCVGLTRCGWEHGSDWRLTMRPDISTLVEGRLGRSISFAPTRVCTGTRRTALTALPQVTALFTDSDGGHHE